MENRFSDILHPYQYENEVPQIIRTVVQQSFTKPLSVQILSGLPLIIVRIYVSGIHLNLFIKWKSQRP